MSNVNINIGSQVDVAEYDKLETALINKYGANFVTTYYKNANTFIFSCSKISNRVIKLYRFSTSWSAIQLFVGTSWVSGSNVVGEKRIFSYDPTPVAIEIILGDDFLLICQPSNKTDSAGIGLIGKLSNGVFVGIGVCSSTKYGFGHKFNSDGTYFDSRLACFSEAFVNQDGYFYKQPVYVVSENVKLELNLDGSFAFIKDLYNISCSLSGSSMMKSLNYIITPSDKNMYTNNKPSLQTSLFAEFS